jgi:hypothetical protein
MPNNFCLGNTEERTLSSVSLDSTADVNSFYIRYIVTYNFSVFRGLFFFSIKWCCSRSSITIFSQIWLYSKYESTKILSTLSCCKQLWRFLVDFKNFFSFIFYWMFFFLKGIWQNILFSNTFRQMGKINPRKSLNGESLVQSIRNLRSRNTLVSETAKN